MLFVIGLELSPQRLWVMRRPVFGTGLLQVLVCSSVFGVAAYTWFGLTPGAAAIVGGSLALSSTAFGLQILAERKEAGTSYGRQSFAILLFQDLAAIPLIAAVPLLASTSTKHGIDPYAVLRTDRGDRGRDRRRPLSVATDIPLRGAGRFGRSVDRYGAVGGDGYRPGDGRSRCIGHAGRFSRWCAAGRFGISPRARIEYRTVQGFAAGPVLHQRRHVDADPSVAAIARGWCLGSRSALLLVKGALLWPLGLTIGGLQRGDAVRLAVLLACGGEFAFVLLRQAAESSLIDEQLSGLLVLAITLSMGLTPLLVALTGKLLGARKKASTRPFDTIDVNAPRVIVAGYGRMGQIVARVLRAQEYSVRGAGSFH